MSCLDRHVGNMTCLRPGWRSENERNEKAFLDGHGLAMAMRGAGASGRDDGRLGVRQGQEQRKRKGADRFLHGVYHARTLLLAQKGSGLGIAYMQAS